MIPPDAISPQARLAFEGEVAIIFSKQTFLFEAGHRMRSAKCLVCDLAIGDQAAAVLGIAALDGAPCVCGGIVSDVFLLHVTHMPIGRETLKAAITRGLGCDFQHAQP